MNIITENYNDATQIQTAISKITELSDSPYVKMLYSYIDILQFDVEIKEECREYRAETLNDHLIVIYKNLETNESLQWIFLHELSHLILMRQPQISALLQISKSKQYKDIGLDFYGIKYWIADGFYDLYYSDCGHENDLEEIICNNFATFIIGKDYSRKWWRNRLDRKEE